MSALFSLIGSAAEWSWRTGRILWYNGLLGAMAGSERSVLNVGPGDDEDPSRKHRPAEVVALELQKFMLKLKGIFMDENGRGVDYKTLKESSEFAEYREKCKELRGVDLSSLSKNEKMSFFLNIYNALTLHGLTDKEQLPGSVLEVRDFWKNTCYDIGGHTFSLDDIEHGVLRANRPHPSTKRPQFERDDPRLQYILEEVDPRIHFALVCGAKSCPPINVYGLKNLEFGLSAAARGFIQNEIQLVDGRIVMSKIFEWYGSDFGDTTAALLDWCYHYMSDEQASEVRRAFEASGGKVSYSEYNWQLNSKS